MPSTNRNLRVTFSAMLSCLVLTLPLCLGAAAQSWTPVTPLPENQGGGTMLLLTDGSVMMINGGGPNWLRLTPDASGNYAKGTWSVTAPMTTPRLFFASQVLPNGKLWVLGGEYSGVQTPRTDTATAEVYDPVANTWTRVAPYPAQGEVCGDGRVGYDANTTIGSNVLTGIADTTSMIVGWSVTGPGAPPAATIASIDSMTQVTLSSGATETGRAGFTFTGPHPSCFGATETMLMPGGTQILAGSLVDQTSRLYTIATDSWSETGTKVYDRSDEEGWALTSAPARVVVYDIFQSIGPNSQGQGWAEGYNPASGSWMSVSPGDGTGKGTLPVVTSDKLGAEFGPTLRLQDGRILEVGANGLTALYTPSTNTWAPGPTIMGTLGGNQVPFGADDAPGATLLNGHVLLVADAGPATPDDGASGTTTAGSNVITGLADTSIYQVGWGVADADGSETVIQPSTSIESIDSPTQVSITTNANVTGTANLKFGGTFSSPTQIFDYNPTAATITNVTSSYPGDLTQQGAYNTRMVVLPTGQVLFSINDTRGVYLYTPSGTASASLRPVINNITYNGGGKFTLTGRQMDGPSAGASYGDDVQMDSNYPVLRLTNSSGAVYYCKTTNWNGGTVGTAPSVVQTANFTLKAGMPAGSYTAIVSAAGISSAPVAVNITAAQVSGQ